MKKRTASIIITATLLVSGCGASQNANPATTPEPDQQARTASATPASSSASTSPSIEKSTSIAPKSSQPSPDDSSSAASESSSTPSAATSSSSEAPSTVSTAKAGTTLRLADFFEPDESWEENRYDVADRKNVSGIGADVSTSYEASAIEIELRLANDFDTLKFTVGQANNSNSSASMMVVQVLGNNKQLDIQTVPFNKVQPISVPVAGVNAVVIRVYLEESGTGGSVKAVLSDISVE